MTGKTHIAGGLSACLLVDTVLTTYTGSPLFYLAGIGGSLLPDICHRRSKIGRRIPILSYFVSMLFGHRTLTHSLLFVALLTLFVHIVFPQAMLIRDGLLVGLLSHIVLDMATTRGVQLFYPFSVKIRLPLYTKTGGVVESAIFLGFCAYILIVISGTGGKL
ncbi:metal-dependent hydrolase [Bacillus solitudinis]|uniref:metal-dependent hydrolase n=1 Tax=Bacillus solitudinis TaxID=2014074 RepID=UPI000C231BDB|nr:metal-dependent hydrolase [Bacillus solitudinis]